ncbi:MAG TPA: RES family NAD+ phosphorylase [Steroidobacteraceae bacterium]|nr:RES family NAD+ phosphorylase [Steroidobacteraceae bacterium]
MAPALPPLSLIRRYDTHRLIPSQYGETGSVLGLIADDEAHLADIFQLDHATNDRLLAENQRLGGIGVHELVFGVPYYRMVNAAFTHPHPFGSRFNGPERGAWYAAFELRTAQAEVAFHKTVQLAEIGCLEEEVTYDEYLADVSAPLHDLREAPSFGGCLAPESYVASQLLAERLLAAGSLGVIYPSVRRKGGTCLALFRPVLVNHLRKGKTWRFRWQGKPVPVIEPAS